MCVPPRADGLPYWYLSRSRTSRSPSVRGRAAANGSDALWDFPLQVGRNLKRLLLPRLDLVVASDPRCGTVPCSDINASSIGPKAVV